MSRILTKSRLEYLFGRLNDKLADAGQEGEIYIVGGAMMALAHHSERATEDIDAHIRKGRRAVNKAVQEIATEEDLSRYWLNEAVTMQHLPQDPDRDELRGHIYLTKHVTVAFATRRARGLHALPRNIGPEPVINALDKALRGKTTSKDWLNRVRETVKSDSTVAPAIRNTAHLVVTGVMPQRALIAVCEWPEAYEPQIRTNLQAEAGLDDEGTRKLYQRLRARKGLHRPSPSEGARRD